jgi:tetratricopeptide (TPR) repeat protein
MRKFLIILILAATNLKAQPVLIFDKHYVESEDKWVAFQPGKDSSYVYGFIYIDEQAGLTLNYEGTFKVLTTGEFIPTKIDNASYKVRLQANNVLVAFIPETKFHELQITETPEWLQSYKSDTNSVARLYRWGFLYNGWDECAKALTYLERAQKIDPTYKGLAVELAFSYNCLSQFDKGILILQNALKEKPADPYINKELVYALTESGQQEKAAESCKAAIAICTDKTYNGEMCYNLLHNYYLKKDKAGFLLWLEETKKWTSGNSQLTKSIRIMEDDLGK